jgi:hypothetical protein
MNLWPEDDLPVTKMLITSRVLGIPEIRFTSEELDADKLKLVRNNLNFALALDHTASELQHRADAVLKQYGFEIPGRQYSVYDDGMLRRIFLKEGSYLGKGKKS